MLFTVDAWTKHNKSQLSNCVDFITKFKNKYRFGTLLWGLTDRCSRVSSTLIDHLVLLSRAYTVRFSSDFEPNSDSCDCFLSRAEFQLCRASFAVQCSCSVQGKREAISLSRQAIGRSDEFLTCQKFWSLLVRVSHSWSRATNRLP